MTSKLGLDSGYSRKALARLALSVAAAQLADQARALVHTDHDGDAQAGSFLERAQQLLGAAQDLVQHAAVLERERGASWDELGALLEVTKQAVQQRFAAAVDAWRCALDEPLVPTRGGEIYDCRLPEGPDDPEFHIKRLDTWLARHQEAGDARSVSAGLHRADLVEQVAEFTRQARLILHETDPSKIRRFKERKAAVLTAIAEERPRDVIAAAAAEAARAALESSRA